MDNVINVIIPVYNAEKYLKRCIESILKQTYVSWKLILVDDGSTDESNIICKHYSEMDERITLIHQNNQGSVAARRAGVLSDIALQNEWTTFCDADDILPENSLKLFIEAAIKYNSDLVVGNLKRIFKNIFVPETWKPECFRINHPVKYTHDEIIDKLFISYFGISNLPVSLWGKLFRTTMIREAVKGPDVVRFMGEDLSVSIRIIPKVSSMVIIPEIVYYYRIGGGTTKFRQDMMDEFVALYRYKYRYGVQYHMPQDWQYYMNIELINITKTHIQQFLKKYSSDTNAVLAEIERICMVPEVIEAVRYLSNEKSNPGSYVRMIAENDYEQMLKYNQDILDKNKLKRAIVELLYKI